MSHPFNLAVFQNLTQVTSDKLRRKTPSPHPKKKTTHWIPKATAAPKAHSRPRKRLKLVPTIGKNGGKPQGLPIFCRCCSIATETGLFQNLESWRSLCFRFFRFFNGYICERSGLGRGWYSVPCLHWGIVHYFDEKTHSTPSCSMAEPCGNSPHELRGFFGANFCVALGATLARKTTIFLWAEDLLEKSLTTTSWKFLQTLHWWRCIFVWSRS